MAKGWVPSAPPALWYLDDKGQGATSRVHTAEESRMKPQLWGRTGGRLLRAAVRYHEGNPLAHASVSKYPAKCVQTETA